MTSNIKRRLPGQSTPSRGHRADDPEERFAQRVTLLFIGLIVAVVVIVVAAFVYDYYVGHLKPVSTVGGASMTRAQGPERGRPPNRLIVRQVDDQRAQDGGVVNRENGL